jgi:LysR family transcriptional regulator (chromosome initiation inhibitor)
MALDPVLLGTLRAVVDDGSFEAAARTLHVTPSAVSQRIKALEQVVGQVVVRRAKPCRPTDAGRSLFRLAGQVELLEREALADARGELTGVRARVAVVVNADSLATWFLPALAALPADLAFDVHVDDEDHTADLLRAGTVMAGVTGQRVAVQGCRVRPLGVLRYLACAAPHAAGAFPGGPMVLFNRKDRLQHRFLGDGGGGGSRVHYVPSTMGCVAAVRLGLGWGMVPEQLADDDLAAGRLVDVAPGRYLDVPLYWQCWKLDSAVLGALTDAVTAAAGVLRPA